MFSHLRTIQIRQRRLKHRRQVLRFDTLEDRRVLAGLDVFVFDDVDASRGYGSRSDLSLFDRPVFVDINRDGRFDPSEPWTTTDMESQGFEIWNLVSIRFDFLAKTIASCNLHLRHRLQPAFGMMKSVPSFA
jgi:hypothetical protein